MYETFDVHSITYLLSKSKHLWFTFNAIKELKIVIAEIKDVTEIHYENMPIQIYWKFYHEKMKVFR